MGLGVTEEQQSGQFAKEILQGRGQTADEIAAADLFLSSGQASRVTGQAVNADGGMCFY